MESALKETGTRLRNVGKTLSLAVTVPVLGIGAAAIKAASDVEEMQSKFQVVFKDMAGPVARDLETFSKAAKRNRFELMGMAASFGDILVPMGYTRKEAARMSTDLTKLAVDLASFSNLETADALQRIQGGIIGNHENLRIFGVTITEATLKAELMRMGADRLTGAMLEQAKVQARINLLYSGNVDAQGDAIRTAEGFANSFRGLQSAAKEVAITFGNILLPYALELVNHLTRLAKYVQQLNPETQRLAIVFAGLAAAAGPVVFVLGGIASGLSAILRAITLTIAIVNPYVAVFAAIAAVGVALYKNWDSVALSFNATKTAAEGLVSQMGEGFKTAVTGAMASVTSAITLDWDTAWTGMVQTVKDAGLDIGVAIASFWAQGTVGATPPIDPLGIGFVTAQAESEIAGLKSELEAAGKAGNDALNGEGESVSAGIRGFDAELTRIKPLFERKLQALATAMGYDQDPESLAWAAHEAKNSIKELFDSVPSELDMPEWNLAPSPDDQTSALGWWNNFKLSLTDTKNEAYNVQRYLYDAKAALDILFGSKLGAWADKLTSAATDAVTLLRGFESIATLFEKETWTNITGILATVFDWVSKIAGKVWDWFAGQSAVNTATATGDAISAATGAGATVAGGSAAGGGLLGGLGATLATLGPLGILGWGIGQTFGGGRSGLSWAEQGVTGAQAGTAVNLGTLLTGGINAGGLNFGDPWLGGGGRMAGGQTINIHLEGRQIAAATVPYLSQELEIYGTNF